ncbi:MAG: molecular chaperone GrpE [Solirubrobacteraceae bacterium]|nr:molecular chaperone GrpE [Solirubrobacteraceae bacterium]
METERAAVPPDGAVPPPADAVADEFGTPPGADGVVAEAELGDAADAEPAGDGVAAPVDEAALRERADKADAYLDLAQRTQAAFDNYRKRMTREVRAAEARGIGKLARELLPALDNLDRALVAVESEDPDHHLNQGVRLLAAELSAALGRTGIQRFSPDGEVFDPVQHEAVAQQPVEGAESGTVVQVLQSGYRLNESILRPARVIVAS